MSKCLVLLSFSFLFSCNKAKVEEVCVTPMSVSFKQDLQPIFNTNCATSACHAGTKAAGGLNLEASVSYANLMDTKSGYIDTFYPKASLLYTSMTSVTNPMPPMGKLSKCTTDLILKWIAQKAKNN
jgi:hypothetical protein